MRILLALLVSFTASTALAEERDFYEVKKGEVWDWHDVLKKSANYDRRNFAGIGLASLVAQLNGSPKLTPGTRIRLAPLAEMLGETAMFSRWPEATVLLDARTFALKWVAPACDNGVLLGDIRSLNKDAKAIRVQLATLIKNVPRDAAKQVRQLMGKFDTPRTNRERNQFQKAATCKNYIAILKRSGWALTELHKELATSSPQE